MRHQRAGLWAVTLHAWGDGLADARYSTRRRSRVCIVVGCASVASECVAKASSNTELNRELMIPVASEHFR